MTEPPRWRRWLREPLLHFLVLGGIVFAVDALIASRSADPRVIVIDAEVDAQAVEVFRKARGRAPNEEELFALRRVWLDNEVLYREGLALGMDQGDPAIRDRVIFKSLSMINAGLQPPAIDDAALRRWFEQQRSRYDAPARYDFQEAVPDTALTEDAARAFADALEAGQPADARAGLRIFKDRPHDNVEQSYGAEFARALAALPPQRWTALAHGEAWRVMRLDRALAAEPASFENLRGVVLQDWKDKVMADQRSAAVKALAEKYTVQVREPVVGQAP